jgi:hypothetical protein
MINGFSNAVPQRARAKAVLKHYSAPLGLVCTAAIFFAVCLSVWAGLVVTEPGAFVSNIRFHDRLLELQNKAMVCQRACDRSGLFCLLPHSARTSGCLALSDE